MRVRVTLQKELEYGKDFQPDCDDPQIIADSAKDRFLAELLDLSDGTTWDEVMESLTVEVLDMEETILSVNDPNASWNLPK